MQSYETISTRELVTKYFTFLSERNLEKLMQLFAEKLEWDIPGNETIAPWLGKRHTKAEVRQFFELLWKQTESISGNINNLMVEGDSALVSGIFTSRMLQTNKIFESLFFVEIALTDGLITKYILLEEGYGLAKALTD